MDNRKAKKPGKRQREQSKKLQGAELIRKIMTNIADQEQDLDIKMMESDEMDDLMQTMNDYLEGTGWYVQIEPPEPKQPIFVIK